MAGVAGAVGKAVATAGRLAGVVGKPSRTARVAKIYDSKIANTWWTENRYYENPPYRQGTEVSEIVLQKDTTFVRVYDGEISEQTGSWLMAMDDIKGLSPQQIKDRFSLPSTPKYVTDAVIPEGTTMRTGIAGPVEGWGSGGGKQFDLMSQRVGVFKNVRLLD